ncbi:MAG: hypothetical protein IT373_34425 [Polyangiaceae bacterium]|nr:hypothetical protein [Polyangiaceae bacterium]
MLHRRPSPTITGLLTAVALVGATASEAWADDDALTPGTRPMFLDVGLGPTLFMGASGGGGSIRADDGFPRGKLQLEFGYHFSGDSSGPALGPNIEVSFGAPPRDVTGVEPGLKFWYDIQIGDVAFYLTPSAKLGYGALIYRSVAAHAFNIELGFEGRLIINDRGLVFFRPITVDMLAGEVGFGGASASGFAAFWDLMFGGGATF